MTRAARARNVAGRIAPVLAVATACLACAGAGVFMAPPDYLAASTSALGAIGPDGPLAACRDNLGRFTAEREAVYRAAGALASPGEAIVVVEITDVTDPRYGAAAAVGGRVVRDALTRRARLTRGTPALGSALAGYERSLRGGLRSDERSAPGVAGGSCFFIAMRRGAESWDIALFAGGKLKGEELEPANELVRQMAPNVEWADVWSTTRRSR